MKSLLDVGNAAPRLALAAVLVACAGSGNAERSAAAGGSGAPERNVCWPVVPLQLVVLEHGREWEAIAELTSDGMLWRTKGRRPLGRVVNDVVVDGGGAPLLTCTRGRVIVRANGLRSPYDASDALVGGGMRVSVADDGTVTMGGAPGAGVRVIGPVREARRTAVLLVVSALMGGS